MKQAMMLLSIAVSLTSCHDMDEPLKNGADSPTVYRAPSYVISNRQLTVTNAGIQDEDGVVDRRYTLTHLDTKQAYTNQTGVFNDLVAGHYHLQIQASVWDANIHIYIQVYNSNPEDIVILTPQE
jgi:hypothetical protein